MPEEEDAGEEEEEEGGRGGVKGEGGKCGGRGPGVGGCPRKELAGREMKEV